MNQWDEQIKINTAQLNINDNHSNAIRELNEQVESITTILEQQSRLIKLLQEKQ